MKSEFEEIISLLETRLEKEENGDLYYILAQVYKHVGRKEDYIDNLDAAIDENLTLTYPIEIVRKELKIAKAKDELKVEEVEYGKDATPVAAVAGDGWVFVRWSDNLDNAYRQDGNITRNVVILSIISD